MKPLTSVAEISISYSAKIPVKERIQITTSASAFDVLKDCFNKNTIEFQEQFIVLYLNRNNHILGFYRHSTGSAVGTVVDVKHIYGIALKANASSILLAHNHPSGNLKPSETDIRITTKISDAGKLLDMKVLDHIIITHSGYFSFSDEGHIG